ncbi:MAG: PKD domain-containing protein, partial [Methanosarcinales archaeon]|nr:PKD domain-containing protein [Methanosarcinales archaeon]
NNTNRPPVLDHIGDRNANENSLLEFTINASDPDIDVLAYSASNLPDGAVFDPGTRTFSWTASFEQSGTYPDIHFEVNDGDLADYEDITIVIDNTNRPPVLDEIGDRTADENTLLEFTLTGTDPDGDGLTYSTFNLPDGADFDPGTQTFSWTPSFNQSGPHPDIQFTLSDGDLTDQENITIVVNTTNTAPVLDPVGNRVADENSLLEFTISATDPDGDGVTYSASDLPDGASFDLGTRTFSWTPSFDQAGPYPGIYFEVYDSELTDWENITITVNNINRAPVLDPVGDKSINENALLEFTISATDPDAGALSYCAVNLPDGAVFDPHSQTFSWRPSFDQSGPYHDIQFKVNDSSLTDHENITIVVSNINRPPVLDQITNRSVNEGSLLEFNLTATDPDGDDLAYDASNLPDGAVFDPEPRTFSWTPSFDQAATYPDVCFNVNDGDLTECECITIIVNNTNRQPVLDQIGNKIVCEDSLLEFSITSVDPDGNEITYSAFNLPGGAMFNATTRTFSWIPSFGQAGLYPGVQFIASDEELTSSENITITVMEVDAPGIFVVAPDSEILFQQQFIVNISVDPLMNEIYGVQYVLTFDNSVLHGEWQNEATFLNSDGEDTNVYINSINNGEGTISFAATRMGTTTGVTDPGILASIKFTAIKKGECTDLPLIEVIISDEIGDRIEPVDIINSSICIDENQPPVAIGKSMHKYNNEGEKYLCKVTFNGTGSFDDDGEVVYWRWGFGDGQYGAGETVDHVYLSWNWNGSGYDPFTVTLTVTDDADPHQLDNTAFFDVIVYTAGDVNGDGKVNILDATVIGLEWGEETTCGAYCWEGQQRADRADLNNDCKVNILDAVIIGTCWGHTAWY